MKTPVVWKIYIGNKSPSAGVSIECLRDPSVEITESLAYVSMPIFTTTAPPRLSFVLEMSGFIPLITCWMGKSIAQFDTLLIL